MHFAAAPTQAPLSGGGGAGAGAGAGAGGAAAAGGAGAAADAGGGGGWPHSDAFILPSMTFSSLLLLLL